MKINIYLIVGSILLAFSSCHILKKDKQTLNTLSQKEEFQILKQRNLLNQQSQLVLVDSNHSDFTLMLWPKGKFTFSVSNGFEGEAERVMIKGKHSSQKVLNIKQEINKDSVIISANYSNHKETLQSVKKSKIKVSYNWVWVLGLTFFICFNLEV